MSNFPTAVRCRKEFELPKIKQVMLRFDVVNLFDNYHRDEKWKKRRRIRSGFMGSIAKARIQARLGDTSNSLTEVSRLADWDLHLVPRTGDPQVEGERANEQKHCH